MSTLAPHRTRVPYFQHALDERIGDAIRPKSLGDARSVIPLATRQKGSESDRDQTESAPSAMRIIGRCSTRACTTSNPSRRNVDATPV